ncbi:MAG TPA: EVE domain-containing protein [Pseudolysinimonas sp.]|nr:EVE domain-containing protein [Pseudolysinimonas sp.]
MRYWLGVVQRSHVLRGVSLGIAQTNHGERAGLLRMQPGDGIVYYSPKATYPDGAALREFTAIGRIAEGEPWQADEGDRHPWRRRAEYDESAHAVPIAPLLEVLELTRGNRNWGLVMRRGQREMTPGDFAVIATEMGAGSLIP